MKFGFSFSDQINRGMQFTKSSLKADAREAASWQEGLNNLSALSKKENLASLWRLAALSCFFILIGFFLFGKTFTLQVINGKKNLFLSETNRILVERQSGKRGLIYDREGKILAKNKPGFRATINFSQIPKGKEDEIVQKLVEILPMPEEEIRERLEEAKLSPFTTITLKAGISHEAQLKLSALAEDLPGIGIAQDILRDYPMGENFAHLLGYLGAISVSEVKDPNFASYLSGDFLGRDGLEKTYEQFLRGEPGKKLIEVDAAGVVNRVIAKEEELPGDNLYLSLDADFQEKAAALLNEGIKKFAATAGVFIAEEVKTGQILAFVVSPSFDNNLFSGGIASSDYEDLLEDASKPLFDRAISGTYPPGSTVKPMMAAAALQEKVITPSTRIDDYPQVIKIGPWEFPDWTVSWGRAAHGIITVREAIAQSCDTFFYKIGGGFDGDSRIEGLGIEKIKSYFNLFGLGQKTGIDLPGEAKGLVPDPIWKEEVKKEDWFLGNTYHISIGQGELLTTPMQILQSINMIANEDKLVKPRLVQRIESAVGKLIFEFEPEVIREGFVNKDYIDVVAEGMRMAVSDGIITPLRNAKVPVAAKTGTAEFGTKNAKGEFQTHAWVTGFVPFDNPEISFVLLLESGGKSNNAAEVAREILDYYFEE